MHGQEAMLDAMKVKHIKWKAKLEQIGEGILVKKCTYKKQEEENLEDDQKRTLGQLLLMKQ